MSYILSIQEGFLSEWLALPREGAGADRREAQGAPTRTLEPDGGTKKQLKYLNRQVNRLRSGDYRVFYTFDDRFVSLLKVVRRSEDTYEDDIEAEYFGGPPDSHSIPRRTPHAEVTPRRPPRRGRSRRGSLPSPIDAELLDRLKVPKQFQDALLHVTD